MSRRLYKNHYHPPVTDFVTCPGVPICTLPGQNAARGNYAQRLIRRASVPFGKIFTHADSKLQNF